MSTPKGRKPLSNDLGDAIPLALRKAYQRGYFACTRERDAEREARLEAEQRADREHEAFLRAADEVHEVTAKFVEAERQAAEEKRLRRWARDSLADSRRAHDRIEAKLREQIEQARAAMRIFADALLKYGHHTGGCALMCGRGECDCDWEQLRAAAGIDAESLADDVATSFIPRVPEWPGWWWLEGRPVELWEDEEDGLVWDDGYKIRNPQPSEPWGGPCLMLMDPRP